MRRPLLAILLAAMLSPSIYAEARKSIATEAARLPAGAPKPSQTAYLPTVAAVKPEPPKTLVAAVMLQDIGYSTGFRFYLSHAELVLALDDLSAHDARRSLEVLVNDRSAAAIALDGKSTDRVAFVAVIALSGVAMQLGLIPDDAVTLWASAIAAGEGQMPIGRILAAYPTIPFLVTSLLEFLTPAGTPAPALLSAAALALLASIWFRSFRDIGISFFAAAPATLLIAFHPALLRAAIAGPAEMFLALFLFLLGQALYDLRARSTAPEVMAAALALLGLTFAHPMGAALTCAAIPFLILAVRPELVAGSAFYVVLRSSFRASSASAPLPTCPGYFPAAAGAFLFRRRKDWRHGASGCRGFSAPGSRVCFP
jgi:hypothetical protein